MVGALAVGGGLWVRDKLEAARESRINTNLETRFHDYGFPFNNARNPMGEINVYDHGKKADIRCAKGAEQVIGFYISNEGPRDIELYLPLSDTHGNPLEQVSWPVGSPEQVQTFLEDDLPRNCAAVKSALASN